MLKQLEDLDNVQLRSELVRHGEKVGPVTPTTRALLLRKLANKLCATQHPLVDTTTEKSSKETASKSNDHEFGDSKVAVDQTASLDGTPTGKKGGLDGVDKEESCTYYVVILSESVNSGAQSVAGTVWCKTKRT